jgi:hypothetical protein
MRVRIRGRYFRLVFDRLPKSTDGICDFEHRTITIRRNQRGEAQLDTLLHELLHAAHWDLAEESIEETAKDLARVLWRLGYRRQEPASPIDSDAS